LEKTQAAAAKGKRSREALVAILAVVLGVALIAGLLVYFELESRKSFPGRESLQRIVSSANRMTGMELEPVAQKAAGLADWFYVRGFEHYELPPELRDAPAVGSRLYRQDGCAVAQVAIDLHESLIYVFNPKDFGVQLPTNGEWRVFEIEGWAAAARQGEKSCTMLTFHGSDGEMQEFISELEKK
jgi:hypothetical protein